MIYNIISSVLLFSANFASGNENIDLNITKKHTTITKQFSIPRKDPSKTQTDLSITLNINLNNLPGVLTTSTEKPEIPMIFLVLGPHNRLSFPRDEDYEYLKDYDTKGVVAVDEYFELDDNEYD